MTGRFRDAAAPHWLAQLLRSKPEPVPWSRAVRAAIALALPLAIAFPMGNIGVGALISTGVLPTVLADAPGPYAYRAHRLGGVAVAACLGFGAGLLTGGTPAASVPTVIGIAAVSALISAAGSNASVAALQLFVFTVLGTGQHLIGVQGGDAFGWFVAGAGWGLLVALAGWTVRAVTPERDAVAQVYVELAGMLSAEEEPTRLAARHQLTTALNTAYDRLLTARSWLSGRDETYRKLLNRLFAGTAVIEASVALVHAGQRAPREVIDYLVAVATSVHAGAPLPPAPKPDGAGEYTPLYAGLAELEKGAQRERRPRTSVRERLTEWARSLIAGPLTWVAALRLTVCVALAEVASLLLPLERSYWITLTVGIVLKPDFGSVFGRAVLRGLGTVAGAVIGAGVLGLGTQGWVLVLFVAVFAGGVVVGKARNYGVLSAFVTPLIIVQMDLSSKGDWSVLAARLIDTVLGCAIVLVFGYLLWPGSMRPRVGGRLADTLETVAEYVDKVGVAARTAAERADRARARRRAYRALTDLRTAFQQAVVEPAAAGRQASAWWPSIVGLERVADAVTELAVTIDHGADPPASGDVRALADALEALAAAVRDGREPDDLDLPGGEQLAGVTEAIDATADAIRGPDFTPSAPVRLLRRLLRRSSGTAR